MIADYTFYRNEYHGKTLNETEFERLAVKSEAYLDKITFGRAGKLLSGPDPPEALVRKVRLAACAVAEIDAQTEASGTLSAESTDGYSVTYATTAQAEKRRYSEALRYLAMTGLMYSGIV